MTTLTPELLAELERLSAEVDRLESAWDGKNMGHAQQLSYAEEELGKAMSDNRAALLAAARELHALKSALEFLGKHRLNILAMPAERAIKLASQLGWVDPFTTGDKA